MRSCCVRIKVHDILLIWVANYCEVCFDISPPHFSIIQQKYMKKDSSLKKVFETHFNQKITDTSKIFREEEVMKSGACIGKGFRVKN